jgi:hypothetical protein
MHRHSRPVEQVFSSDGKLPVNPLFIMRCQQFISSGRVPEKLFPYPTQKVTRFLLSRISDGKMPVK